MYHHGRNKHVRDPLSVRNRNFHLGSLGVLSAATKRNPLTRDVLTNGHLLGTKALANTSHQPCVVPGGFAFGRRRGGLYPGTLTVRAGRRVMTQRFQRLLPDRR